MNRKLKLWLLAVGMISFVGVAYAGVSMTTTPSGTPFTLLWGQDSVTGAKVQASALVNPLDASLVPVDPCQGGAKIYKPILYTTAGSTTLIAGVAGKKIFVCSVFMFTSAANPTAVVEGSGANCATSPIGVIGGATTANGINFTGNQGFSLGNGASSVAATTTLGNDVCAITSQPAILAGVMTAVIQ